MNIEWNSEEVNHDYPLTWNQGPFKYHFSEVEEVIIEQAKQNFCLVKTKSQ
jgi:hypothetical protein